jgi:hypothetical protein
VKHPRNAHIGTHIKETFDAVLVDVGMLHLGQHSCLLELFNKGPAFLIHQGKVIAFNNIQQFSNLMNWRGPSFVA